MTQQHALVKRFRLFACLFLALVVIALGIAPGNSRLYAQGPSVPLRIEPGTQTIAADGVFRAHVYVDVGTAMNPNGFGAGEFDLVYDPSHLKVISVVGPAQLASRTANPLGPIIDNPAGRTAFGVYSYHETNPQSPGPTGSVKLADVTLQAKAAGATTLGLENMLLTDTQANAWSGTATAATLNIAVVDIGVIKDFGKQFFYAYDAPSTTGGTATPLASDTGTQCISRNDNVTAMAAGDFDGDDAVEVAVIKQFGSRQFLYIYSLPGTRGGFCMLEAVDASLLPRNDNVAFMAAGNFDTSDTAEELAVVKSFGSSQFLFIYNPPTNKSGAGASLFASETTNKKVTRGDNIAFMAGGNFDGDAVHEVAVVKTFGSLQFLYIYDVPTTKNGIGTLIADDTGGKVITRNHNVEVMTAGNFDGDATNEVAVIKKFGTRQFFYIYDVPTTTRGSGALIGSDISVLPRNDNVEYMAGLR